MKGTSATDCKSAHQYLHQELEPIRLKDDIAKTSTTQQEDRHGVGHAYARLAGDWSSGSQGAKANTTRESISQSCAASRSDWPVRCHFRLNARSKVAENTGGHRLRMNSPWRTNDKLFMFSHAAQQAASVQECVQLVPISFMAAMCHLLLALSLIGPVPVVGQETSTIPDAPYPSQTQSGSSRQEPDG